MCQLQKKCIRLLDVLPEIYAKNTQQDPAEQITKTCKSWPTPMQIWSYDETVISVKANGRSRLKRRDLYTVLVTLHIKTQSHCLWSQISSARGSWCQLYYLKEEQVNPLFEMVFEHYVL